MLHSQVKLVFLHSQVDPVLRFGAICTILNKKSKFPTFTHFSHGTHTHTQRRHSSTSLTKKTRPVILFVCSTTITFATITQYTNIHLDQTFFGRAKSYYHGEGSILNPSNSTHQTAYLWNKFDQVPHEVFACTKKSALGCATFLRGFDQRLIEKFFRNPMEQIYISDLGQ